MDDQPGGEVPSEAAQAWASVRRVREPVAWTLLVLTAIGVLISAWQLLGLPGTPTSAGILVRGSVQVTVPAPGISAASGPVPVPTPALATSPAPALVRAPAFAIRASDVGPGFVSLGIIALPVLSVILVAFAGGVTVRARRVVQTALSIQAVALGLGVVSLLGALSDHSRSGVWFISFATDLAVAATALAFTVAVERSQALRSPRPACRDLGEEDEDFGDDELDLGNDVADFGNDEVDFGSRLPRKA